MTDAFSEAAFFDDPSVPRYFIHGLEDVVIFPDGMPGYEHLGAVCELIPWTFRRSTGGLYIRQPEHTCIAPVSAVPGMAALATRKVGGHKITSTVNAAARALRLH